MRLDCGIMIKIPPKNLRLKLAYDAPAPEDGRRALVDRLWPRGLKKEAAALDLWAKDLAGSDESREMVRTRPRTLGGIQTPTHGRASCEHDRLERRG